RSGSARLGAPMPMMRTALVLDGGSGQALEVVRSLGRAGWRVLAPTGTRSGASRFARPVAIPDSENPGALGDAIRVLLQRERVDVLVPCTDASAQTVWERHAEFGAVPILGGDRPSFELASDKVAGLAAAERVGFPVPRWRPAGDLDETTAFARELGLPVVVKPRRSFTLRSGRLVQRRHRLITRADVLPAAIRELDSPEGVPVLQEYVPGRS